MERYDHAVGHGRGFSALLFNIIGLGLAPLIIGILSDGFSDAYGKDYLRIALLFWLVYLPIAVFSYARVARGLRQQPLEMQAVIS